MMSKKLLGIFPHWPELDKYLIPSFARPAIYFACCNRTTLGLIVNSLWEVL